MVEERHLYTIAFLAFWQSERGANRSGLGGWNSKWCRWISEERMTGIQREWKGSMYGEADGVVQANSWNTIEIARSFKYD